jgi:DnaJ-class molecular chaperone
MSHAEICPVCLGKGKVQEDNPSGTNIIYNTCHGCGGQGWVTVKDEPPYCYYYSLPPWPSTITYTYSSEQHA